MLVEIILIPDISVTYAVSRRVVGSLTSLVTQLHIQQLTTGLAKATGEALKSLAGQC